MDEPHAQEVDIGVAIDVGAPLPHLVSDGSRSIVIFHAGLPPDPAWDGSSVTVITPDSADSREIGWVMFEGVSHVSMGHPNDEALASHSLYGHGLTYYTAHEVNNSALLAELETANSAHPHHKPRTFSTQRHVIITFHDETLECVCQSWTSGRLKSDFASALVRAATALRTGTMN